MNFTLGKEVYKCYQQELLALSKRLTSLKKRLTGLIDKDAKTYLLIVRAYKLPSNTERENNLRKIKIQEALKKSTLVTLDILTYSQQALSLSKRLLEIGNKNLISDVGVGACMLEAGIKGALLNIEINLTSIKDVRFINDISIRSKNLVNEAKKIAYYVITETSKRMLKK
ncbi:MAG: cyclodeaminase/cyclohydrolase family protein [Candidatus Omnitrophica bacterium]|nr:cyclodeaminase/cyclohydrolase family protein [Candidatus Omnitrophota bacterium]